MRALGLNQRLAILGVVLGAIAIFATVHRGRTLTVHEQEFAVRVQRAEDHVTPSDLAAWIVAGRQDFRLWDLRDAAAYAEYHIPGAENVPVSSLGERELPSMEKVVLYSEGEVHASQAMMLLWAQGKRNVYTLLGGLASWKDDVLFPVAPANPSPADQAAFERRIQLARYFGGQPRAAAGTPSQGAPLALPELPKTVAPPPPPPAGGGAQAPRAKKQGC